MTIEPARTDYRVELSRAGRGIHSVDGSVGDLPDTLGEDRRFRIVVPLEGLATGRLVARRGAERFASVSVQPQQTEGIVLRLGR